VSADRAPNRADSQRFCRPRGFAWIAVARVCYRRSVAVRATLTASLAAVALVAAVQAAAAPRMDDVCKYVDRRGNVDYRDCAPPTTYVEPVAPVVQQPAAPKPVAAVTPANAPKPARSLSAIWRQTTGAASKKSYSLAGVPLLLGGMLVALLSSIQFLIGAFRVGLWWGLGCLFLAPVSLAFLVMHWKVARQPFLVSLGGLAAALVGYYVLGVGT